jgi:predicted metal-dependent peptidase
LEAAEKVDRIRFARAYCAEHQPWFAPALYAARIILTEQVAVAAIDQHMNVYWNPKAVEEISSTARNKVSEAQQLGFLWLHELFHVLRDHAGRCEDMKASHQLWNIAADLEINDGIWKPLVMPEAFPGLLPKHYNLPNGQLAEWYYRELLSNPDPPENTLGDEGSGVHGQSRTWEESVTGQNEQQDGQNARQTLHPLDIELIKRETALKLDEAIQSGRFQGQVPGGWRQWVELVLHAKKDWRKILRNRMSVAIAIGMGARVDYSYRRPNRRQAVYAPVITPTFSGDQSARVACVVDTSGSMGADELASALGQVFEVLKAFHLPVTIIPCDSAAYEPIMLKKPSDVFLVKELNGGGGTDMTVGIRAAMALQPKPDSILVLTDGYTPYPARPMDTPVVFGIFYSGSSYGIPTPSMPPWQRESVVWIERGG